VTSLWNTLASVGGPIPGALQAIDATVTIDALTARSSLARPVEDLRGRSALIATRDQLTAALALLELDGIARRVVLCTADLSHADLADVATTASADLLIADAHRLTSAPPGMESVLVHPRLTPAVVERRATEETDWVLLTSGTTGAPKLVRHTFASLAGRLPRKMTAGNQQVWSTFYDIRRYGGLQIFLRALLTGSPLVLSSAGEPTRDFLARLAAAHVTHISGTPSHWRRALMSGAAGLIAPAYVRLSGEIADQAVLDNLHAAYPRAQIAHAFASTEAGVAFDVGDGLAGFPSEFVNRDVNQVALKIEGGTLRIRSLGCATCYLGTDKGALMDPDGFVDTGDMVELRDGRYYFVGRKGGVINVGGLKVHPEEVEAVINADPRVWMSLARPRKSSITGAVVVADVVLIEDATETDTERLKRELLDTCRRALPAHKVPTMLRFVSALELTPSGKLVRHGA
jgi:acyl-coenzyme A synthetase/AMP-(fatty) acid ligase